MVTEKSHPYHIVIATKVQCPLKEILGNYEISCAIIKQLTLVGIEQV